MAIHPTHARWIASWRRAEPPDPLTTEEPVNLFLKGAFASVAEARLRTTGSEAHVTARMDPRAQLSEQRRLCAQGSSSRRRISSSGNSTTLARPRPTCRAPSLMNTRDRTTSPGSTPR
ncbi:hypothetical protein ACFRAO_20880 [Streptomyces sp. NPDC056656]|uniref:hypothetical protein n=1 Tax=Streptomyces sp. NPDC056656 TaxID=3345895 RepID=UPI00367D0A8A